PLYSPGLPSAASAGSLVRVPPFFRTSAGHRVEGRNPWHLQCSRNQLRAGTQFRRLVRSLSLRPSWLLASWADQTKPRLSLPKASTSGLPVLKSPRGLPDMTTAPNGELRRQDLHLQVQQLVSLRSVRWVTKTRVGLPNHALAELTYGKLELVGAPAYSEEARDFARAIQKNVGLAPMADPFTDDSQRLTA